jgi:glycosyltransferase involved in cell wall biosynthesis
MKIIHFSKSDDKGAFLAAYRFHQQLLSYGYTSVMIVAKKTRVDAEIIEVRLNFFQKISVKVIRGILGFLIKNKTLPQYYFFNYSEKVSYPFNAIKKSLPFTPDIIINHWVTGFVNSKVLFQFYDTFKSKIFWQFNDLNAFTGGCHYSNGCTQYFQGCGNCPALSSKKLIDQSYKNYQQKLFWLSKTDITYISTTTEIHNQLSSSAIAKVCKTKFVMLCVNDKIFKLMVDKEILLQEFNLPSERKIIFFGAQNIADKRKGFKQLLESLNILKRSLSTTDSNKILLVYASYKEHETIDWPFEAVRIPYINDEITLAKIYQITTVFVSPSVEDAGPMSIAESISCGTPTIAFNIGLANDIIINNVTGFIVPLFDCNTFALRIQNVVEMSNKEYELFSNTCASKSLEMLSVDKNMNTYELLFKD